MNFALIALAASALLPVAAQAVDPYEVCTKKNDYLESSLMPAAAIDFSVVCQEASSSDAPRNFDDLSRFGRTLQLPPECVRAAQQRTPEFGYTFGTCSPDKKAFITKGIRRPCQSENYHFFVYVSYLEAMSCLGLDPRELFALLSLESNFQVNIGSHTGAWGVGQLTGPAITTVNMRKLLEPLKERQECASVKALLDKPYTSKTSCEKVDVPNNPALNFIYAGLSYQIFRKIAARAVSRYKIFSKMKPADKERAIVELTRLFYNGGDSGVLPVLRAYTDEKGGAPVSFSTFRTEFRDYLKLNYGESVSYYKSRPAALKAKRREVAMYPAGIEFALRQVEKASGVKCSL